MNMGRLSAKLTQSSLLMPAGPANEGGKPLFAHPFSGGLRRLADLTISGWKWIEGKRTQQLANRRMRVAETVSLGDKRFVSILHVDGTQFLVGGAANQVHLLAVLNRDAGSTVDPQWQKATSPEVTS